METKLPESMALLALSHTPVEQQLYEALLAATAGATGGAARARPLSLRQLLELTGLNSYSTLRRARAGLIEKLSITCQRATTDVGGEELTGSLYQVYGPEEVFTRRQQAGLEPYPREYQSCAGTVGFSPALERVVSGHKLSRRAAQVALCCAEGLTNAEIGAKLLITEQTAKYHR